MDIKVYKIVPEAILPRKATELSACSDICACLHNREVKFHGVSSAARVEKFETENAHIRLYPKDIALIPTGLIFCLPENKHLKFYSRSGMVFKRGLSVANAPAVIDSDYIMESFVLLHNISESHQIIYTDTPIAQIELCDNIRTNFVDCDINYLDDYKKIIKNVSSRNGGIGSTDK